ncbi:MAG TPA: lipid II flippase MurJ, partial [Mycobacterium sp.]
MSDLTVAASPDAVRGSATVAAWTLVSRVTGLGRIIVTGAVLGPTYLANCFVATNTVPNMFYLAIAGSVLSAVVVPAIVRATAANGSRAAVDLIGRLAGFLVMVGALGCAVLLVVSPVIARLLTFDIADVVTRSHAYDLTLLMLLFVAPQVIFYMIATLGAAAQQARGRFALAAAAPAVENLGVMMTIALAGFVYGKGAEIGEAAIGLTILLCVGSTISVALHMALQLAGAARVGLPVRPCLRFRGDPLTTVITRRLRQSFVVAACPYAAYLSLIVMAGTVAGGVLVLQMAYSVYSLPLALGGRAVSTAVLPGLSAAADRGDRALFGRKLREGFAYAVIAGLPPMLLLATFAAPIAEVLANGRMRVGDLITALACCLVVLAVAQAAAGLREVGVQGLFAGLEIRGPRIAAALGLTVTLTAGLLSVCVLAGSVRLIGLAAAILLADLVAAAAVIVLSVRMIRPARLL